MTPSLKMEKEILKEKHFVLTRYRDRVSITNSKDNIAKIFESSIYNFVLQQSRCVITSEASLAANMYYHK